MPVVFAEIQETTEHGRKLILVWLVLDGHDDAKVDGSVACPSQVEAIDWGNAGTVVPLHKRRVWLGEVEMTGKATDLDDIPFWVRRVFSVHLDHHSANEL